MLLDTIVFVVAFNLLDTLVPYTLILCICHVPYTYRWTRYFEIDWIIPPTIFMATMLITYNFGTGNPYQTAIIGALNWTMVWTLVRWFGRRIT